MAMLMHDGHVLCLYPYQVLSLQAIFGDMLMRRNGAENTVGSVRWEEV